MENSEPVTSPTFLVPTNHSGQIRTLKGVFRSTTINPLYTNPNVLPLYWYITNFQTSAMLQIKRCFGSTK